MAEGAHLPHVAVGGLRLGEEGALELHLLVPGPEQDLNLLALGLLVPHSGQRVHRRGLVRGFCRRSEWAAASKRRVGREHGRVLLEFDLIPVLFRLRYVLLEQRVVLAYGVSSVPPPESLAVRVRVPVPVHQVRVRGAGRAAHVPLVGEDRARAGHEDLGRVSEALLQPRDVPHEADGEHEEEEQCDDEAGDRQPLPVRDPRPAQLGLLRALVPLVGNVVVLWDAPGTLEKNSSELVSSFLRVFS